DLCPAARMPTGAARRVLPRPRAAITVLARRAGPWLGDAGLTCDIAARPSPEMRSERPPTAVQEIGRNVRLSGFRSFGGNGVLLQPHDGGPFWVRMRGVWPSALPRVAWPDANGTGGRGTDVRTGFRDRAPRRGQYRDGSTGPAQSHRGIGHRKR